MEKITFLQAYNIIVTYPFLSAIAGFGYFWLLKLMGWPVFCCIFLGMYATALFSWLLRKHQ